ncbi:septum site-determining protein Ssd [Amycolatopsis sp. NPDC058986]|uniref:septum site-determining protein Ssd n=1 Tax=unclassified Amycolatopsis TaxID=2618356 RepID=UPI003670132B
MTEVRPLVVATDETVLEEILRVAAVAGCEPECAPDLAAARARWARAPLVVLDQAAVRAGPDLPRRGGVVLICKGAPEGDAWRHAYNSGADRIIALPDEESALAEAFADVLDGPAERAGRLIGVIGGSGGAGASVLAGAIALAADEDPGGALLIDCDPLGGGVDLLLGLEKTEGRRWPEVQLTGRVSLPALLGDLPQHRHDGGGLPVLSCGRDGPGPSAEALAAVLAAGRRAGRTVVCDLPRGFGEEEAVVVADADLVVLAVPVEARACMAAKQVMRRLTAYTDRIGIVACGRSPVGFTPQETAALLGPPLLAFMPPERGLAVAVENGEFRLKNRGPLAKTAEAVLAAARCEGGVAPR